MRLHFTIRDLLWLTLVVAMGVGWCFDESHRNAQIKLLEDQYARDHGFSIDERIRLIDGLKAVGPEAIEVLWVDSDGYSWNCNRQLAAIFTDAGWQVSNETVSGPALSRGVSVFYASTREQSRKKGQAIAALLLTCCGIDARAIETDKPNFRIESGRTFFSP